MAEFNMTDKEQVDMLKKWWKDYGRTIAIALVIGLLVAFGWRYWRGHNVEQVQKAAALYGQLSLADSQHKAKDAETIATELIKNYRKTAYATLAALWWARQSVNDKNYNQALQKCEWVIKNSHIASFRQIARIRAARTLLFQKKPQAALDQLKKVDDKTYQPLIDEVKGDVYTAMKKPDEARKAYKRAQTGLKAEGIKSPILEMKVADS